jgi:protein-L-isoaspartate(D-aspartate) O-methyltransferase
LDGAVSSFDPADVILASAGATHPLQSWLDALKPEGRLLFPMTSTGWGPGAMLLITRHGEEEYAARFLCRVGFIDFQGARQESMGRRLAAALRRDLGSSVKSLRRDVHARGEMCWLHGKGWCLSRLSIGETP